MNSVQSVALFYYNITHIFRWVNKKKKRKICLKNLSFLSVFLLNFYFFIFFYFTNLGKKIWQSYIKKKNPKNLKMKFT